MPTWATSNGSWLRRMRGDGRLDGKAGPLPPVRPAAAAGRPAGVAKAAFPRPPGRTR
ncbi:hypothetical protein GT025_21670 [Streptomyces sp. SID4920]|nr:hypothetical protein [Streptomyces sp. SID4920]MYX69198.1 hypothetical protein [Streptomyces sp. SID8373]